MEAKINIEDYLTVEEVKEEIKSSIRFMVRCQLEYSDLETLISNLGYKMMFELINQETGVDCQELIKQKIKELLEKDDSIRFELWHRKNDHSRMDDSKAIKYLDEAIDEYKDLIKDKVKQEIDNFEFDDVKEEIFDIAYDVVRDRIFGSDR